jgi:hypothetical protein
MLLSTIHTSISRLYADIAHFSGVLSPAGRRREAGLAEMATCQMEFKYLAQLTGKAKYFRDSDKVMDLMQEEQGKTLTPEMVPNENGELVEKLTADQDTGLWTLHWNLQNGKMFSGKLTK